MSGQFQVPASLIPEKSFWWPSHSRLREFQGRCGRCVERNLLLPGIEPRFFSPSVRSLSLCWLSCATTKLIFTPSNAVRHVPCNKWPSGIVRTSERTPDRRVGRISSSDKAVFWVAVTVLWVTSLIIMGGGARLSIGGGTSDVLSTLLSPAKRFVGTGDWAIQI